jgi:hypothetical protein
VLNKKYKIISEIELGAINDSTRAKRFEINNNDNKVMGEMMKQTTSSESLTHSLTTTIRIHRLNSLLSICAVKYSKFPIHCVSSVDECSSGIHESMEKHSLFVQNIKLNQTCVYCLLAHKLTCMHIRFEDFKRFVTIQRK